MSNLSALEFDLLMIKRVIKNHGECWKSSIDDELRIELIKNGFKVRFVYRGISESAHYQIIRR